MNRETSFISSTEIRWVVSHSANCLHVADVLRRGQAVDEWALCKILEEPTQRLRKTIEKFGLAEEPFWNQLLPLSANIENNTQLVEQVLRKTIGSGARANSMVARLAGRVADVEAAVRRELPQLVDRLAERADTFAAGWLESGPTLLDAIGRRTDPRFIVPQADVILVPPVLGGGGVAHLPYNTVRIEAVETDPVVKLPEVVRLAWLIAQLNVDLPMFSEMIPRDHLPLVAAMAMLPVSLDAAAELHLTENDPMSVRLAIENWHIAGPAGIDLAKVASNWWESHLDLYPAWNVSLAALDRMIHDEDMEQ